jgi:hypothetical protein
MFLGLCIFLIFSFFELKALFKAKEKKEAGVYIFISIAAVSLAAFLMLVPDHASFADIMFKLFNISL